MTAYTIERKRWQALSLFEQMGNIGSEVGRTYKAQQRSDEHNSKLAMARAIDLLDATCADPRYSFSRKKEILRAKEEFIASITQNKSLQDKLEQYFMQFAIAARLSR